MNVGHLIHRLPSILTFLLGALSASSAHAGDIAGKIELKAGVDVSEVVVYVEAVPESAFVPKVSRHKISQRGARFRPAVLPIVKGAEVDLTNDDWVKHSVYSYSLPKIFDLGLYGSGVSKIIKFDKLGEVELGCFIHPKMSSVILVLQNPFFTTPAADGSFVIRDVPGGDVKLKAYIRGEAEREVVVEVPKQGAIGVKL